MTHRRPTPRSPYLRWINGCALALAVITLVGSSLGSAMAQSVATPSAPSGEVTGAPKVGDEVAYINANGGTIATLTITKFVRPWTEFNDYYTPDSGSEYVAFEIYITHLGTRGDLIVRPDDFRLQDADGFLLSRAWVTG